MDASVRKLSHVPSLLIFAGVCMLVIQLTFHYYNEQTVTTRFKQLMPPMSSEVLEALSLGSNKLMSYLLLLNVQSHDNQKGQHISYDHLDYGRLRDWLKVSYDMNPESDYPLFLAMRVYSQVKDPEKTRIMIELVDELFDLAPERNWRRMTEAALLAKHQLQDLNLALKLAEKIAELPREVKIPFWARDMKLILLDELNQQESAVILISSILQSEENLDSDERRFLESRLLKIQQKLSKIKR